MSERLARAPPQKQRTPALAAGASLACFAPLPKGGGGTSPCVTLGLPPRRIAGASQHPEQRRHVAGTAHKPLLRRLQLDDGGSRRGGSHRGSARRQLRSRSRAGTGPLPAAASLRRRSARARAGTARLRCGLHCFPGVWVHFERAGATWCEGAVMIWIVADRLAVTIKTPLL